MDLRTARRELTDHRRYRYRGCAPDVDDPTVASGDNQLPVTAWETPDTDGGEPQTERIARERAAIEVCVDCPVMVQCMAYGASVTRDGRLAVPYGILGGLTALERHRQFVKARQQAVAAPKPAPVRQLRTPQKLAVLRALAAHAGPGEVAAAAGMDLRTANWQRSILRTKLGLPETATRMQLLNAATAVGLLDGVRVVGDDGSVPAVPPPGKTATAAAAPKQQALAPAPVPASVPDLAYDAPRRARTRSGRRQGRFTAVTGQLALDIPTTADIDPAPVAQLPTRTPRILEPAA
ncbi:WhiB family transcriptional regulator [Streptomyces sp. NPDC056112]|uniref:WhiB family transcriptional regulator n=1 Tax=Streptomyces sp. NPDC056112 TaxID=3345715 RepID=UPI0035DEE811